MKLFFGLLLIVAGIAAGLYFGLYWAFIGGIVSVIEQVRAPSMDAMTVAVGIARILCAGLIGSISAFVLILPGAALVRKS